MIEFALTVSITLLMTFGMIEFSRVVYTVSILQWAAQAGARAAIVDPDHIDSVAVTDAVRDRMAGFDLSTLSVAVGTPDPSTNEITVSLAYTFEFILPLISAVSGGDIELTASASMVAF